MSNHMNPNGSYFQIKSENGQMTIEMILIAIVLMSVTILFTKQMRAGGYITSLTEGPWSRVQVMIEDGVWTKPSDSRFKHPNHFGEQSRRRTTIDRTGSGTVPPL